VVVGTIEIIALFLERLFFLRKVKVEISKLMTFEFDRALIFNALPKARASAKLVRKSTNQPIFPIFIAGPLRVFTVQSNA
jgi:hypothetical protein